MARRQTSYEMEQQAKAYEAQQQQAQQQIEAQQRQIEALQRQKQQQPQPHQEDLKNLRWTCYQEYRVYAVILVS